MTQPGNRNYAAEILKLVNEAYTTYTKANESLSRFDLEFTDLSHACELLKLDAIALVKVSKEMKENRIERRKAKNETEQLQGLIKWVDSNWSAICELKGVSTTTGKLIASQGERTYKPRIRKDLKKKFKEVGHK